jgi:galactose mutarotase-like enzyme
VEFAHPRPQWAYRIANPERYVDEGGAVLFRFVNRSDGGQFGEDQRYFQLVMRLEGTIG